MRIPTVILSTILVAGCSSVHSSKTSLEAAAGHVARGDHAAAITALEFAFRGGAQTAEVLNSEEFRPLLDDSDSRPLVRELVKQHTTDSKITMVRPAEPGEPLVLTIRIVSGRGEPPGPTSQPAAAGVVVGIVHVDAEGYYQRGGEEKDWNPRLFGSAVTDETGHVVVHTIRPAHYGPNYKTPDEPLHVHYDVTQDGRLLRAAEFFFEDDERLTTSVRQEARAQRVPIATIRRGPDGTWYADVTIPVRGLR